MQSPKKNKTVIIVTGSTAVGKTEVAIKLATQFGTEIISADSRQCYKELVIGVARPSAPQLKQVKHHFIASHSIKEEITAAEFEHYALNQVNVLFEKHDIIVMVGGTGLYIKAFCEGLDKIPGINPDIRMNIISNYENKGLEWLQEEIKNKDPLFFSKGEIKNPQRMMRALEVIEATGESILNYHTGTKTKRDFSVLKIGLELPKEDLKRNIGIRTDKMMEAGLLDEVKQLLPFQELNALQTVGYKEMFKYLNGHLSLTEATELIKTRTRQYAKRQMTWFKKDKSIHWFSPADYKTIEKFILKSTAGV